MCQTTMMTRKEAQEKINAIHSKHFADRVECSMCGEVSEGLKVVDDLDIYGLATLCCGEPVEKYGFFPFNDRLIEAKP